MRKICKVTLNNERFLANCGDLLLDWALMNGIDLPHDCRSGICGACRVRLVEGRVFGGHEHGDDMIHACQARIVSDLEIVTEPVPDQVVDVGARGRTSFAWRRRDRRRRGAAEAASLSSRPVLQGAVPRLPGAKLQPDLSARGPSRRSPAALSHPRFPDGIVSSALGRDIRVGHRVKVTGPFGSAFLQTQSLRPHRSGRQRHRFRADVVDCGRGDHGTAEARADFRGRGTQSFQSLYMHAALCRLALFPNVTIIPIVSEPQNVSPAIRSGRPTDHLPKLSPDDVVYTSGAPAMTESVARIARAAGARCYTDPFVPNAKPAAQPTMMGRLSGWLDSPSLSPAMLRSAPKQAQAS